MPMMQTTLSDVGAFGVCSYGSRGITGCVMVRIGPHPNTSYNPPPMFRHVPNLLTGLRLVLAGVFFAMLGYYQHDVSGRHGQILWLNIALVIYVVAVITDFLDGYLARRWHVEGAFGRVVDPFVDKVLILGSFIFFAGKNFTVPFNDLTAVPTNVKTITGVVPWMVVVILARELLVTSLRGISESTGGNFGASLSGKLKMITQSATILIILLYVNYQVPSLEIIRNVAIWVTIIITVVSGLVYVQRAVAMFRKSAAAAA
jgi:CDP-diacylglycerol---glycerol-3-phosphate 3-phosphatidyltransferase